VEALTFGPLVTLAGATNWTAGFLTTVAIFGVLALALNLQWGYTGVFNFGVVAFFMVGAYTSAVLTLDPAGDFEDYVGGLELPVLVGWGAGMLAGGLLALVIHRRRRHPP
jgi:branched-chain amino acid transport system permease protein